MEVGKKVEQATEAVDKASGFFDRVNQFIKRHPIWFVAILISALLWWGSTLSDEEYDEEYDEVDSPMPIGQEQTTNLTDKQDGYND